MTGTVHITGSWGELTVHQATGIIISYDDDDKRGWDPGDEGYHDIARFDPVTIAAHSHYDILATGFWDREGNYAAPMTVRLMADPRYPGMDFDEWVPAVLLTQLT